MKTYYHNTNSRQDNIILGYVTKYGDFIECDEKNTWENEIAAEVVVSDGLSTAGETLDQFKLRITTLICKHLNIN